jgi:DNA mismatch repair protein MutS2
MPLAIGAEVVVKALANKRGVVTEATAGGRYRVRVGSVSVWCREEDLAVPQEPVKKKRTANKQAASPLPPHSRERGRARRIDLHGLTVEQALAELVTEIDRAILAGADRVEVVHGKGSGRIKHAVHRHLASMQVVAAYELDDGNTGVTWVYL